MNFVQARVALMTHFKAQFPIRVPGVPIAVANDTPLVPSPVITKTPYVDIFVLPNESEHHVIGSRERWMGGRVRVRIFIPEGIGVGRSSTYGDQIADLWDTARANGLDSALHLGPPEFVPGGPDPKIPFWMDAVSTRYHHWLYC